MGWTSISIILPHPAANVGQCEINVVYPVKGLSPTQEYQLASMLPPIFNEFVNHVVLAKEVCRRAVKPACNRTVGLG